MPVLLLIISVERVVRPFSRLPEQPLGSLFEHLEFLIVDLGILCEKLVSGYLSFSIGFASVELFLDRVYFRF